MKQELSEEQQCFKKIVQLVNYKERCTKELRDRLLNKEGLSLEAVNLALKKALKYDIVNDERYAEMYCLSKTLSYHGVYGVKKHLKNMQIDYEQYVSVVDILNNAEKKEYEFALKYIDRHRTKSKNQFASYVKKLVNRGYSVDTAINVTKDFINSNC